MIFVGIDWSEQHHDVCVLDGQGQAVRRVPDGVEAVEWLHELLAGQADDPGQVTVGIELDRGLLVSALAAAGDRVVKIEPVATVRYRDRFSSSRGKADASDARVLADAVRTDAHLHRAVTGDSGTADAVRVLARVHQTAIWERRRHAQRLRHALREFFPAALEAFDDLTHPDALAILAIAPSPDRAARLSRSRIVAALRRAGRQRNAERRAEQIQAALRTEQLQAAPVVADAHATAVASLVAIIAALDTQVDQLADELADRFGEHSVSTRTPRSC